MPHGKSALATLILALVLAAHAWAGEPSGPATSAAPPACTASAPPAMNTAALGAPPVLLSPAASSPAGTAADAPVVTCGCGESVCTGKRLNSLCGVARLCQRVGTCAAATTPKCRCLPPP